MDRHRTGRASWWFGGRRGDLPALVYKDASAYTYTLADLTNHYHHKELQYPLDPPLSNGDPINSVKREFVDLKDGVFIIHDKIDINHCLNYGETGPKDCSRGFQFHFLRSATGISLSGNALDYSTTSSDVRVTVPTHPSSSWVYATEESTRGSGFTHYYAASLPGDSAAKTESMLTVFDIRDTGVDPQPVVGLAVTGGVGTIVGNKAILFVDGLTTTYTADATTHYIADLPINSNVEMFKDAVSIGSFDTGTAGIITFASDTGSGLYTIGEPVSNPGALTNNHATFKSGNTHATRKVGNTAVTIQ